MTEITIEPIMTYDHPPEAHKNDASALPTAPNMKLLTTNTVFNLLRSSLDRANNLACAKTDIPCTAIENTAAIRTIAIIEVENRNPPIMDNIEIITNIPKAGTLKPLSCSLPK